MVQVNCLVQFDKNQSASQKYGEQGSEFIGEDRLISTSHKAMQRDIADKWILNASVGLQLGP